MSGRLMNWNRYFLLPDRFSNNQDGEFIDNNAAKVSKGTTARLQSTDKGNALQDTQVWLDAGAKFCGGTLRGLSSKLGYLRGIEITAL
jgi:glycosidase